MRYYWENPVGDIAFLPGEMPDENDISYLNNILSAQQMEVFHQSVDLVRAGITDDTPLEPEDKKYDDETIEKVKSLKAEGVTLPNIAKTMNMTVPDIVQILSL